MTLTDVTAGVLKPGYLMCISKEALDDGTQLILQNKTDMLRSIGCWPTVGSVDGAVLDRGFMTSKVLLKLPAGESIPVWVPSEALAK
jgi:hypothetical protein